MKVNSVSSQLPLSPTKYPRSRGALMLAALLRDRIITQKNIQDLVGRKVTISPWFSGYWLPVEDVRKTMEEALGIPASSWEEIVERGDPQAIKEENARRARLAHARHLTRQPSRGSLLLLEFMAAKMLSNRECEALLGVGKDRIVGWTRGIRIPGPDAMERLKLVCGIPESAWGAKNGRREGRSRGRALGERNHGGRSMREIPGDLITVAMAKLRQIVLASSQREVSVAIGANQTSVSLWCRGVSAPRAPLRAKMLEKYGIGEGEWFVMAEERVAGEKTTLAPQQTEISRPKISRPKIRRTAKSPSPLHDLIVSSLASGLITQTQATAMLKKSSAPSQ